MIGCQKLQISEAGVISILDLQHLISKLQNNLENV